MSVRLFKSLLYKSTQIQQEIEQEQRSRWPDRFRLLKLKKIRLTIKDRLERLFRKGLEASLLQPEPRLACVRATRFKTSSATPSL